MTNREAAIRAILATAATRHPGVPSVELAIDRVLVEIDQPHAFGWPAGRCFEWSTGSATLAQRGLHAATCREWEEHLEAALRALDDALEAQGDPRAAEVAGSAADESGTAVDVGNEVFTVDNWWGNAHWSIKLLAVLAGAKLVQSIARGLR